LLRNLSHRLNYEAPRVAASILEGLDEMLTVDRLALPAKLRRSGVRIARNFSREISFSLHYLLFIPIFFLGMLQVLAQELYGAPPQDIDARIEMLVKSYPDWISERNDNFLIMKQGNKFQISDGKATKTFDELLEHPDIDDMFYASYPVGSTPKQPDKNSDPGRVRFESLFVAMYGDCKENGVTKNLRNVDWLPRHAENLFRQPGPPL
jgi:hypothetical protein